VVCALATASGLAAADLPELLVEAPPELAGLAETVRRFDPELLRPAMRLVGLEDPGPPIRVVLAPESSPTALSTPAWISGFAASSRAEEPVVVLLPARVPRYPDGNLAELLQHEVAHVLITRAAGGRPVPRWFHEGLAMAASRGAGLEDRTRVALAVLVDGSLPLRSLDRAFPEGPPAAHKAYALSRDFVETLLRRHGQAAAARILAGVARGQSFDQAFAAATGETLAAVEASFWRRRTFWNRWVPVLSSSAALWIGITMLALVAFRRRQQRDQARRAQWDEEEEVAALARAARANDDLVN
jgi:peptidase MA superfamily protein